MRVVAAVFNPTSPHGWRPYHRPDCWYATKKGVRPDYWDSFHSVEEAEKDGRRPCQVCRPEAGCVPTG